MAGIFELTNEQRKYLGIAPIEDTWEQIQLSKGKYDTYDTYVYFDGDTIRRQISVEENYYTEYQMYEETSDNRQTLLPKTIKGKQQKLSAAAIDKRSGFGNYFEFCENNIMVANFTTQRIYYSSYILGEKYESYEAINSWLKRWISETSDKDLADIKQFADAERQHCRFKEGDFFRFKLGRNKYGFGRFMLDIHMMRRNKVDFWDVIMGKPVIVKIYHIISSEKNVDIDKLKKLESFPSQFLFHNDFYYGDYEIIGNQNFEENELDYPIMYGCSISAIDPKRIILQYGRIYKTIPFNKENLIGGKSFINNGIGFDFHINLPIMEKCIQAKSNQPYWEQDYYYIERDLRNPKYIEIKREIFKLFGLSSDLSYMKNIKL